MSCRISFTGQDELEFFFLFYKAQSAALHSITPYRITGEDGAGSGNEAGRGGGHEAPPVQGQPPA